MAEVAVCGAAGQETGVERETGIEEKTTLHVGRQKATAVAGPLPQVAASSSAAMTQASEEYLGYRVFE